MESTVRFQRASRPVAWPPGSRAVELNARATAANPDRLP